MKTRIMASAAAAAASSHDESDDETENLSSSSTSSPIITTLLHPDIIHTHILTRLDGPTLAAASSVSSQFRRLCTDDDHLWRKVCTATWPSLLVDPIVSHVISTFPCGHRSFFSDAFPSLLHHSPNSHANHRNRTYPPLPPELITAVDIYCEGKPALSRVQRIETHNNLFLHLPLQLNVLQPHESVPILAKFVGEDKDKECVKYLQENFTLSWILIDPIRKRAANLSSWKPVSVERNLLTWDLEVVYVVAMAREQRLSTTELVYCLVNVTCCRKVGGELHVKEVKLVMESKEGMVRGREGVMILQSAIENGERKKMDEVGAKERFECMMKERRQIAQTSPYNLLVVGLDKQF